MRRRELLVTGGSGLSVTMAGCSGIFDDDGTDDTDEPGSEDTERGELEIVDTFRAVSRGGGIEFSTAGIDERVLDDALTATLGDGGRLVVIEGELTEAGLWRSTFVDFPPVQDPTAPIIEAPNGLGGELEREEGRMTIEGELRFVFPGENPQPIVTSRIEATTGESGDVSGETNFDAEDESVVVVDNEFTIDTRTTHEGINGVYDLPADEPGENWFLFELELIEPTGEPASAVVEDEAALGEPLEYERPTRFEVAPQEGFISLNEDSRQQAITEGTVFPTPVLEDLVIEGQINEDNTWESTKLEFPELTVEDGIYAQPEFPDGLGGDIDLERGRMTIEGDVSAVVTAGNESYTLGFEIEATTEASGSMEGDPIRLGDVRMVDNEFVVGETDSAVLNQDLELPSLGAGRNWFEVAMGIEFTTS